MPESYNWYYKAKEQKNAQVVDLTKEERAKEGASRQSGDVPVTDSKPVTTAHKLTEIRASTVAEALIDVNLLVRTKCFRPTEGYRPQAHQSILLVTLLQIK